MTAQAPMGGRRSSGAPRGSRGARRAATESDYRSHVQRTYGITSEQLDILSEYQGGRCWGCRRATGASKRLAVDHDHRTGEVRMQLCSTCNQLVGHFRDDPVAMIRLALALVQPPSRAAWAAAAGRFEAGWEVIDLELVDALDYMSNDVIG